MELSDTETAVIRAQEEEDKYKDIYGGEVRAGNEILYFKRTALYQNQFSVMLPKSFVDMPKALTKLKYPSESRPGVIKTNDDTTVNFAFAYYNQDFAENQIESAAKGLKTGLARLSPGARFFDTKFLKTEEGIKFSCFDFLTTGLDTELYQLFAFIPVHQKFLHVIFNVPSKAMRSWQPVAMQVLQSIRNENGIESEAGKDEHNE